jgi:hypothetical protein
MSPPDIPQCVPTHWGSRCNSRAWATPVMYERDRGCGNLNEGGRPRRRPYSSFGASSPLSQPCVASGRPLPSSAGKTRIRACWKDRGLTADRELVGGFNSGFLFPAAFGRLALRSVSFLSKSAICVTRLAFSVAISSQLSRTSGPYLFITHPSTELSTIDYNDGEAFCS